MPEKSKKKETDPREKILTFTHTFIQHHIKNTPLKMWVVFHYKTSPTACWLTGYLSANWQVPANYLSHRPLIYWLSNKVTDYHLSVSQRLTPLDKMHKINHFYSNDWLIYLFYNYVKPWGLVLHICYFSVVHKKAKPVEFIHYKPWRINRVNFAEHRGDSDCKPDDRRRESAVISVKLCLQMQQLSYAGTSW